MVVLPIVSSTRITAIDIRPYAGAILDQGDIGSCMENALVSAIDLSMRECGHAIAPLSRLQSYADTRLAQNTFYTDSGSSPYVTLDQSKKKGIAFESTWKYDDSLLYQIPSTSVYAEAAGNKVKDFATLNIYTQYTVMVNGVKQALSEGKPVILAFKANSWLFNEHGPLADQIGYGPQDGTSGHAVIIVGADDNLNGGSYVIKNSWGTSWGDGGYGSIRYDQFNAALYPGNLGGMWTITGFRNIDWTFSQERKEVAAAYVSIFNRCPDHTGQDWWVDSLSHGNSIESIYNTFLNWKSETQIFNPLSTNAEFINTVYISVLDRAPGTDAEGRAFWTSALDSGFSRGIVLHDIVNGSMNYIDGSNVLLNADGNHSKYTLLDRVEVAMHYGVTYQADDVAIAKVGLVGVNDQYATVTSAEIHMAQLLGLL